jgi:hypothetical protein
MKDSTLTIRVSEEQKRKLEAYSYENDISISKTIRNILDKELSEPEVIYLGEGRYYNEATDKPLLLNYNFSALVFWLYDKYLNPNADENDEFYFDLIDMIDQINQSRLFSNEFLTELEKVKGELEAYLENHSFSQFSFPYREDGFDYEILRIDFHMIKFNSDNKEVVNLKNKNHEYCK